MIQVTMDEAKDKLPDLVAAVRQGETVFIETGEEGNTDAIQLVAVPRRARRPRRAGSAKGLILYMADDFDAPLEDFREYME